MASSLSSPATPPNSPHRPDGLDERALYDEVEALLDLPEATLPQVLQQRLDDATAAGRWHERAYIQLVMARHRGIAGNSDALDMCHEAETSFVRLGSDAGQAAAAIASGGFEAIRGEFGAALEKLGPALRTARSLGWPDMVVAALCNLAAVEMGIGNLGSGIDMLEEALRIKGDGLDRGSRVVRGNLALNLTRQARALRDDGHDRRRWVPIAERAVALMRQQTEGLAGPAAATHRSVRYSFGCLAAALVVLDDVEEAVPLLQRLRQLYEETLDPRAVLFVDIELTRAALQSGRPQEAAGHAERGLAHAEAARGGGDIHELHRLLSEAREAMGDHRGALQAHRRYHLLHKQSVLDKALISSRALAITLETDVARRESRLDALTSLPNRRAFDEMMARALPKVRPGSALSLALIDLDHFKQVNDAWGHAEGDDALTLVADVLLRHCRPDDSAARLGGDEFVLVVAGDAPAAEAIGQRVRQALRQASSERWPGRPPLTLSIGIASTAMPCAAQDLLRRADRVLYDVKAAGRDAQAVG